MNIKMRFAGGTELAQNLGKLATAANTTVTRNALKKGAEPIRSKAAASAPRRPPQPDLADHIVISTIKVRPGETAAIAVGPEEAYYHGLFQEIGTAFHGARPFMRPAFDTLVGTSLDLIRREMWAALERRGIVRSAVPSPSGVGNL